MRQADSSIRGYIYQFNKSILEILTAADDAVVTVEGIIEDIDIQAATGLTTIQCKYHESQAYKISSVAVPILEMLGDYCDNSVFGTQNVKYILYAYFKDNVDTISSSDFLDFLATTQDKEILLKHFHRIYTVSDARIVELANKLRKKPDEKNAILDYYNDKRTSLKLRIDINDFWNNFTYVKAERFDSLNEHIITEFTKLVDADIAHTLYYPNAFSKIALLSSKADIEERRISKGDFLSWLSQQETVLITKWAINALNAKQILKNKRDHLASLFATNPDVRAFFFSREFLNDNRKHLIPFIIQYLNKYYKKPKLQKPPIFIFADDCNDIFQEVVIGLYKYQRSVNTGEVAGVFMEESFVNDTDCASDYKCKITPESNMTDSILERCHVNQLYCVGQASDKFNSISFCKEFLEIGEVNTFKYLIGLEKTLEVS